MDHSDESAPDDSLHVVDDVIPEEEFVHPKPVPGKSAGRLSKNPIQSGPKRKAGRPRKPGLPRAPKLPVVLMTRSGRMVKQRTSHQTGGNAGPHRANKASMPTSQKWKNDERYQLLYAIQRHGLEDLDVLINYIPTRTLEELQWEINRIRLIRTPSTEEEGKDMRKAPIDTWLDMAKILVAYEHEDHSTMLTRAMSIISNFEPRAVPDPSSEPAQFVNYQKIYQYLQSLMEQTPFLQTLSPIESAVIVDLMHDIGYTLHECCTSNARDMMLWKYDLLTKPVDLSNHYQNRLVVKHALENDSAAFHAYVKNKTIARRSANVIDNHTDVPCFPSISAGKSYTNPAHEKFRPAQTPTHYTLIEIESPQDMPGTSQGMATVNSTEYPNETIIMQAPSTSREITAVKINGQSLHNAIQTPASSQETVIILNSSDIDINQSETDHESQSGIVHQEYYDANQTRLSQTETLRYTNLKPVHLNLQNGGSSASPMTLPSSLIHSDINREVVDDGQAVKGSPLKQAKRTENRTFPGPRIKEEVYQARKTMKSNAKTDDRTNVPQEAMDRNSSHYDKSKTTSAAINKQVAAPKRRKKSAEADLEKANPDVSSKKRAKKTRRVTPVEKRNDNMVTVGSQLSQKLYDRLNHSRSLESVPESACIRVPLPARRQLETTMIDQNTGKYITIVEEMESGVPDDTGTNMPSSEPGTSDGDHQRVSNLGNNDSDFYSGTIIHNTNDEVVPSSDAQAIAAVTTSTTTCATASKTVLQAASMASSGDAPASTSTATSTSAQRDTNTTENQSVAADGDNALCRDKKSLTIEKPKLFTLNPFCIPVSILKLKRS